MKRTRSAGGVVVNTDGMVLVINQNRNSWSLPKGHLEEGEDEEAAARREVREESGVKELELVRPLGSYERFRIGKNGGEEPSELKVIGMFLFRTREQALNPLDPHNPEARWVKPREVAALLTHPRDKEFFLETLPLVEALGVTPSP